MVPSQKEKFAGRDCHKFDQVFFKVERWWGIKSAEGILETEEKEKYLVDMARSAVLLLNVPK